jgi:hypothetical protein
MIDLTRIISQTRPTVRRPHFGKLCVTRLSLVFHPFLVPPPNIILLEGASDSFVGKWFFLAVFLDLP